MHSEHSRRSDWILTLHARHFEVFEAGCAGMEGHSEYELPEDPGRAAEVLLRTLGSYERRPKRCQVVLGPSWLEMRTIALPDRPRRELQAILQRKAAGLLECEVEDVLWAALPMSGDSRAVVRGDVEAKRSGAEEALEQPAGGERAGDARGEGEDRTWLLLAMKRSRLLPLLLGLRRRRIAVRRILPQRVALLGSAWTKRSGAGPTCLAIAFERNAVALGVLHDGALRHQSVVEGDIEQHPALAMTLLQELKSTEAWWRKAQRGSRVDDVVILGLPRARGELFEQAVLNALPEAKVVLDMHESDVENARLALLDAVLFESPLRLDLALPLPWRKRTAIAAAGVATAAVAMAGTHLWLEFDGRRADAMSLADGAKAGAELYEQARSENEVARAELERRSRALQGLAAVESSGCPFDLLLDTACLGFADHAALMRIAVHEDGGALRFEAEGRTHPEAFEAFANIESIRAGFLSTGLFSEVTALPEGSGASRSEAAHAEFRVVADLRGNS